MREVRWERMFPHELEEAFAACPAVWLAYGLCEPHGPQNALGLDLLKAHGLVVRAAREHGGIVAPPDPWHVHELGGYAIWAEREIGEASPWLTAVPPWVHFKNVCYHVRAAEALGFRAAILLTGHYGPNWQDLKTLVDLLQPWLRLRLLGLPDFEVNHPGFPGDGADGDHAGKVETSLLWALEPELVDASRIPREPQFPLFAMGRNAAEASREAGEQMVADIVAHLGEKQRELLAAWDPERPSRLRTFEDVERFWSEVIEPRLSSFKSLRSTWYEKAAPDEGSRWRENWPVPARPVRPAMTEMNRKIIRRYIDDLNQRRLEILDEVVAPQVVLRSLLRAEPGAETVSREEYKRQIVDRVTAFPDYHVTAHTLVAEGDQVVVHWTNQWTHRQERLGVPPTGKQICEAAISIYRLTAGQIVEVAGFWDRSDLWQQLGLLPATDAILRGECARS